MIKLQRWSVLQGAGSEYPTWSHDGQFIYFVRVTSGPGVYRVLLAGGKAEQVVDLTGFRFTSAIGFWMGLDPEGAPMLFRDVGGDDIYARASNRGERVAPSLFLPRGVSPPWLTEAFFSGQGYAQPATVDDAYDFILNSDREAFTRWVSILWTICIGFSLLL